MTIAQIVANNEVINTLVVNDAAVITNNGTELAWPGGGILMAPAETIFMMQAGAAIGWVLTNGVLVPPTSPPYNLTNLKSALLTAVGYTCTFIVQTVQPVLALQVAFLNAASIVNGNGGAAPTTGPLVSRFDALATNYGITADQLATLCVTLEAGSLDLANALLAITAASAAATTPTQLATALTNFESSISTLVTEVNSVVPMPIPSPPAITIAGINA
jgi:hypothetical protein